MRKILSCVALFGLMQMQAQERPKLVVGIVVDQMKMEYLYRFHDDFGNKGFRRLTDNGFIYRNMHFNYLPTYTAPGHASIYTGTTPSVHGIMGNDWYSERIGKSMYCTDDANCSIVGEGSDKEGAMSPVNLLSTTVTDELRLSTNFRGKVIGMSLKDRGAILPAGHFANAAFWYSNSGNFISSTYYGAALPAWINDFNAEKQYMRYIDKGWNMLRPLAVYDESQPDSNPYEGKLHGAEPVFPYNLKAMYEKSGAGVIRSTPFGNDLLASLAMRAIEKEQLGKDAHTDFLAVSFSSPDYIGHTLGPRSIELQDTYLRLDETIAQLLDYLDKTVGKNNYLVFLTADHAGAENVSFLKDQKYKVDNSPYGALEKLLRKHATDTYGVDIIADYSNYNVFFNYTLVKEKGLDISALKKEFAAFLMKQPMVKRVYTAEEILASGSTDYYLRMIANGFDENENGDLVVLWKPGFIEYGTTGTSHGSPYAYDTHVPAIFYGWNVSAGESFKRTEITQIAPTLSQMIRITMPNGSNGEVLEEVLKTQKVKK